MIVRPGDFIENGSYVYQVVDPGDDPGDTAIPRPGAPNVIVVGTCPGMRATSELGTVWPIVAKLVEDGVAEVSDDYLRLVNDVGFNLVDAVHRVDPDEYDLRRLVDVPRGCPFSIRDLSGEDLMLIRSTEGVFDVSNGRRVFSADAMHSIVFGDDSALYEFAFGFGERWKPGWE
jgi:hypothetical protein